MTYTNKDIVRVLSKLLDKTNNIESSFENGKLKYGDITLEIPKDRRDSRKTIITNR